MAKNRIFEHGRKLTLPVAVGVVSGDPVLVGSMTGIALMDRDSDGEASVDFGGVYDLSVEAIDDGGNSAVAIGDPIFYTDADTPKLNKKSTGAFFGFALEVIATGQTDTIKVTNERSLGPGQADIPSGSVGGAELATGVVKQTIIAGGVAGAHTVTGIATEDELVSVIEMDFTDASETGADLTSEFSITAADTIDNTAGTDTSGGFLLVTYINKG